MPKDVFEFLCIYFQRIYTTKKKKKFLMWVEKYLSEQTTFKKKENVFYKENAKKLIIVSYPTPEKYFFGKKYCTRSNLKKKYKEVTRFKLILLIVSVGFFMKAFFLYRTNNYFLSGLFVLAFLFSYFLSLGIPRRNNFTHLATITTAIEIFRKDAECNLLFVENISYPERKLDFDEYREIWILRDLYAHQELLCFKDNISQRVRYEAFSGVKNCQDTMISVPELAESSEIPNKIYTSLHELKMAMKIINEDSTEG